MRPPPEAFVTPLASCPSCGHGIDPHGLDPGGPCGVGTWSREEGNELCQCMWSPNDIAMTLLADERERIAVAIEALTLTPRDHCHEEYNAGLVNAVRIARNGGGDD